jgi:hypothetical protein
LIDRSNRLPTTGTVEWNSPGEPSLRISQGARLPMTQYSYDVVPYKDGWAIVVTPGRLEAFPTRLSAFDTGVEFARKLRFVGFGLNIRMRGQSERAGRELPQSRRRTA